MKITQNIFFIFALGYFCFIQTEQEFNKKNKATDSDLHTWLYNYYADLKIQQYNEYMDAKYPLVDCNAINDIKALFLVLRYEYLHATTFEEKAIIKKEFHEQLSKCFWDEPNLFLSRYCQKRKLEIIENFYRKPHEE